jgi:hypothetical protein
VSATQPDSLQGRNFVEPGPPTGLECERGIGADGSVKDAVGLPESVRDPETGRRGEGVVRIERGKVTSGASLFREGLLPTARGVIQRV